MRALNRDIFQNKWILNNLKMYILNFVHQRLTASIDSFRDIA